LPRRGRIPTRPACSTGRHRKRHQQRQACVTLWRQRHAWASKRHDCGQSVTAKRKSVTRKRHANFRWRSASRAERAGAGASQGPGARQDRSVTRKWAGPSRRRAKPHGFEQSVTPKGRSVTPRGKASRFRAERHANGRKRDGCWRETQPAETNRQTTTTWARRRSAGVSRRSDASGRPA
jgi:hypothetical protein